MFFVKNKNIFFALSGLVVAAALAAPFVLGLNFGIDFTGGSLIEVSYEGERPDKGVLEERLAAHDIGAFSLRRTGDDAYLLRSRELEEGVRQEVIDTLSLDGEAPLTVDRINAVGPVIGQELRNKAFAAIAAVVLIIICYVAFAFRRIRPPEPEAPRGRAARQPQEKPELPKAPVSSWKYGVIAIIALLHDIIIPVGLFAILGATMGAEIDILFVMALLAILGYSVNDTIVVFDRVRENLRANQERNIEEPFAELVGRSLSATYARSINTSLTTIFVLVALFFFGGEPTQFFALTLLTGVIAGTYSSIALAAPLLVAISGYGGKEGKEEKEGAA